MRQHYRRTSINAFRISWGLLSELLVLVLLFSSQTKAATIAPNVLHFEARLDESVLLTTEVDMGDKNVSKIEIIPGDFKCDRRITPLGDGKFLIEIAPETVEVGTIKQQVGLEADGQTLNEAIEITGEVKPWIKISPQRLFLGSIGHGENFVAPQTYRITLSSDNELFDITTVEFEGIEGATWSCEPKVGTLAKKKTVVLKFSADALAAGFPYGAVAKKFAVIHTTHPHVSYLPVPIMGMLSVNTTGRNYSTYLYKGALRWQGPWSTPNIAAAFLGTATILLCGVAAALHNLLVSHQRWQVGLAVIAFGGMALGCYWLAQTYSRGGWVGMGIGIGLLLLVSRVHRFYPLGLAILFGLAIALQPAAINRIASSKDYSEDRSAGNRLLVWKGALQMMAGHPWTGVGAGNFGKVFKVDYQLPTHTQEYSTAINDFLTFGAERGIPLLVILITTLTGLTMCGVWIGMKKPSSFTLACAGAMLAYLTSCWFSSIGFRWSPSWILIICIAGILYGIRLEMRQKQVKDLLPLALYGIVFISLFAGMLAILVCLATTVAIRNYPLTFVVNKAGSKGLQLLPRSNNLKGTIFYISDRGEQPEQLLKNTLRPLASNGWQVFCFELPIFTSDAVTRASEIIYDLKSQHQMEARWYIAGHKHGGEIAIALGAKHHPSAVATYLTPIKLALPQLGQPHYNATAPMFLMFATQTMDTKRSYECIPKLKEDALLYGLAVDVKLYPGVFPLSSHKWQLWINDLNNFGTTDIINSTQAHLPF